MGPAKHWLDDVRDVDLFDVSPTLVRFGDDTRGHFVGLSLVGVDGGTIDSVDASHPENKVRLGGSLTELFSVVCACAVLSDAEVPP